MENKQEQPIYSADPSEIHIPKKRQRETIDRRALGELKKSISDLGQLQPGVCSKEKGQTVLIAGHRRLLACSELEREFLYILVKEIPDPHKRKEMELHENIMRENLTFLEKAKALSELHKLYSEVHKGSGAKGWGGWSLEKSAQKMGVSTGKLSEDMELVQYAEALPEVKNAKTKTEAKKVIKRIKSGAISSAALQKALAKESGRSEVDSNKQEKGVVSGFGDQKKKADLNNSLTAAVKYFSEKVHNTTFEEFAKDYEGKPFDIVFFDPPWGVDYDKVSMQGGERKTYEDTPEAYFDTLRDWLNSLWKVMSDDSHLYLKFPIVEYEFTADVLHQAGFDFQRIPIIWLKKGQHHTRHPEIEHGRCYEPLFFARKGKKRLIQGGRANVIPTKPPSPKMKQEHPTVMHPNLIREILFRSARPGDHILDPMAGSGMFGVAAESLKASHSLDYVLVEKEKVFSDLIVRNLLKGYKRIVGEIDVDLDEDETNFRIVPPGSAKWKEIWSKHPELRKEMVKFAEGES